MTDHPELVARFLKSFGVRCHQNNHFGVATIDVNSSDVVTEGSSERIPPSDFWHRALGDHFINSADVVRHESHGSVSYRQTATAGTPRATTPGYIAFPAIAAPTLVSGSVNLSGSFFHRVVHTAARTQTPELLDNATIKALMRFRWTHSCRAWHVKECVVHIARLTLSSALVLLVVKGGLDDSSTMEWKVTVGTLGALSLIWLRALLIEVGQIRYFFEATHRNLSPASQKAADAAGVVHEVELVLGYISDMWNLIDLVLLALFVGVAVLVGLDHTGGTGSAQRAWSLAKALQVLGSNNRLFFFTV